jgi:hypothetical protein
LEERASGSQSIEEEKVMGNVVTNAPVVQTPADPVPDFKMRLHEICEEIEDKLGAAEWFVMELADIVSDLMQVAKDSAMADGDAFDVALETAKRLEGLGNEIEFELDDLVKLLDAISE